MKTLAIVAGTPVLLLGVALAAAIAFGGPSTPPPMASISDPFRHVDFSTVPPPRSVAARDGRRLAFHAYLPEGGAARGSVVLVHGSSARGSSMHVMAQAFARAGFAAYALDMRGHGGSGVKGHIDHIGQLEDDLEDFMARVQPKPPATLAGFSAGGGFALRFAGSARQQLFANYLLLSPFISQDAPTYRPDSGGWVSVGLPRIIALVMLDAAGVSVFNDLPVTRFALPERAKPQLTAEYSFALAQNFRPQADYRANIRAVRQPMEVLAGRDDEAFHADRFAAVFADAGKPVPVTLLPGLGHVALTLDRQAAQAAVQAVERLNAASPATATRTIAAGGGHR